MIRHFFTKHAYQLILVVCTATLPVTVAATAVDFDTPGAVTDYDHNLCATAQRLLINSDGREVEIVVKRAKRGAGFGNLQMDIGAAGGPVVVAMLAEQVDIDGETFNTSVWCKMVNQARVNDVLDLQLDAPARSCRDVNEYTYRHALASLSVAQRTAYDAGGVHLRFADDYNAGAGAAWIPAMVNDYIELVEPAGAEPGYLRIQAPSVQVAWDPVSRDWYRGTHHCKLITLAAMQRWMSDGALRGEKSLFPRSTPVCTEPTPATSQAGSCIHYFGPADSTFCLDYNGSGWTAESAAAECADRHTAKADWLATKRSYAGTGGGFNPKSCTDRNAVAEVRRPPIGIAASGDFGTCVFRCNQADETLWRTLTDIPGSNQGSGGMQRACDLFIPPK